MLPRWLIASALLVLGCGPPDPIVGTWTPQEAPQGTQQHVELRGDGSVIAPPRSQPACENEAVAIAACGRRHRWEKQGARYRITMMTLASPTPRGGFVAMFNDDRGGSGCRCMADVVGIAELHGDELVIDGKERLRRVR
jgi:hypothetical protein